MGTYDTPSGHPVSPPDDDFPESLLRDGVWRAMENEGVPESVMNAVDKLLLDWEIETVRAVDEAAGEAMYEAYLEDIGAPKDQP